MPRGKICRETEFCPSIAAQLPFTVMGILKEGKKPSCRGRGNLGGILRDDLHEGNCKSKIATRQWEVNFSAGH